MNLIAAATGMSDMSDGYYEWWQALDNDARWQWEQEQRLIGMNSSGNPMKNGLQSSPSTNANRNTNSPDGQEKAA